MLPNALWGRGGRRLRETAWPRRGAQLSRRRLHVPGRNPLPSRWGHFGPRTLGRAGKACGQRLATTCHLPASLRRLPLPLCSSALTPCPRASLSTSSFKSLLTCCRLVAGLTPPPKRNSWEGRGPRAPYPALPALGSAQTARNWEAEGDPPGAPPGGGSGKAGRPASLSCHGYHRAGPGLALLLRATRAWGQEEGGHGAQGRWEAKTHPLPEADERHPTSAGGGGREAGAASAPTRQCQGTQQHEPGQSCGCGTGRGESPSSAGGGSALAAASQALAAEQPRGLRVGDPSRDLNAQKPT